MTGSRQHIAELQAVEEDDRRFYARVLIAERSSVHAICVSIFRSATKLRNARRQNRRPRWRRNREQQIAWLKSPSGEAYCGEIRKTVDQLRTGKSGS